MKKSLLLFAFLLLIIEFSFAQNVLLPNVKDVKDVKIPDTSASRWIVTGVTGLAVAQTQLKYWAAGGENNTTGNLYAKINANYAVGRVAWGSALNAQYGRTWVKGYNYKSADLLNLSTKYGIGSMKLNKLYWTALADFRTQFAKGYTNPTDADSTYISNFFAPAYLNLALGADWKPLSWLSIFYSPLAGRFTFVKDSGLAAQDIFGIGKDKKFYTTLGMYLKAEANAQINKIFALKSTLDMYNPYDETFGNIIIDWELLLSAKLTQYISMTFNFGLRYDDRIHLKNNNGEYIGPRPQLKEIIGVGITYNF